MPEITERIFCEDCIHDKDTCGHDPGTCLQSEAADLYKDVFGQLYDHKLRKGKIL
jgi:hypothetical protein